MRWLKKWAYLLLFIGSGIFYLAVVDHWQVYAGSLRQVQEWYEGLGEGEPGDGELYAALTGPEVMNSFLAGRDVAASLLAASSGGAEGAGGGAPDGFFGQEGFGPDGEGGSAQGSQMGGDGHGTSGDGQSNNGQNSGEGGQIGSGEGGQAGGNGGGAQEPEEPELPEYKTVEDDYFSDAVFIGDSRTVGMFEYGGLEEVSTFYASKGMTIYKLFDSAVAPSPTGKITVEEALQQNQFAKIYLMVGINEMGTGTVESFLEKYGEAVAHLRELQPEAIIYLQAIMKVTSERSAKGDYITNEGIEARNEGIALLADNEKVFYLDMNPSVCDDTGGLDPEYTYDGVHLKGKHIQIWKDYLKAHAISP